MSIKKISLSIIGLVLAMGVAISVAVSGQAASPLSGAIFTTVPDGTFVNQNVKYNDKRDVYLDGGPPPNAPASAASLPDDDYVFQVTGPSGMFLLSEDPARCRVVEALGGVIVRRVPPTELMVGATNDNWANNGPNSGTACHIDDNPPHPTDPGVRGDSGQHDTNVDVDHGGAPLNAIVAQLMPYGTTPNPGGVYKVWMTPVSAYQSHSGNLNYVPKQLGPGRQRPHSCPDFCAKPDSGFGPPLAQVKTDNFKVLGEDDGLMFDVLKFYDANGNGRFDEGTTSLIGPGVSEDPGIQGVCVFANGEPDFGCEDPESGGWPFKITDPLGMEHLMFSPIWFLPAPVGEYTIEELPLDGWHLTGVHEGFGGEQLPTELIVTINVPETHIVMFGNNLDNGEEPHEPH